MSLGLLGNALVASSGLVLMWPITARPQPDALRRVRALVNATHADPLAPFELQPRKSRYINATGTAAMAYRIRPVFAVVSVDPIGDHVPPVKDAVAAMPLMVPALNEYSWPPVTSRGAAWSVAPRWAGNRQEAGSPSLCVRPRRQQFAEETYRSSRRSAPAKCHRNATACSAQKTLAERLRAVAVCSAPFTTPEGDEPGDLTGEPGEVAGLDNGVDVLVRLGVFLGETPPGAAADEDTALFEGPAKRVTAGVAAAWWRLQHTAGA